MSKHIVELEPGDELEFKGPIGKVHLLATLLNCGGMLPALRLQQMTNGFPNFCAK